MSAVAFTLMFFCLVEMIRISTASGRVGQTLVCPSSIQATDRLKSVPLYRSQRSFGYKLERQIPRSGFERERVEISLAIIIVLFLRPLQKVDYPISERRGDYLHQDFHLSDSQLSEAGGERGLL